MKTELEKQLIKDFNPVYGLEIEDRLGKTPTQAGLRFLRRKNMHERIQKIIGMLRSEDTEVKIDVTDSIVLLELKDSSGGTGQLVLNKTTGATERKTGIAKQYDG